MVKVKRGDVFLADLSDATGSEQSFVRPVVIIQNNCGNKHSPTTIVACLSSKMPSRNAANGATFPLITFFRKALV